MGAVKRGDEVYADPTTGALSNAATKGAVTTHYTYTASGNVGDVVSISAWI
ncbi:hypothetical protein [Commensalibacter sp. Nvir]|uniref:hypothetical protein n=1 Tax=Commensalibacter sp. Nvir TaxID=3069817 RepID=UPI0030C856F5